MSRRLVILSNGDPLLRDLLAALEAQGVRPSALVLYPASPLREWRALPWPRRIPALPLVPLRWLRRRLRLVPSRERRGRVERVVVTGPLNGRAMERDLRRLRPDVVCLAFGGILSPAILSIPAETTVNVHTGLLPWIRGSGAVANSILRAIPLGCTSFRLDPGIDTGPVLARRLVPVRGGETVEELKTAVRALWLEMTAGLVHDAMRGPLPAGTVQPARFPLCRAVRDPASHAAVDAAVRAGVPKAAFEAWRPFCDLRGLSLAPDAPVPEDAVAAPVHGVRR